MNLFKTDTTWKEIVAFRLYRSISEFPLGVTQILSTTQLWSSLTSSPSLPPTACWFTLLKHVFIGIAFIMMHRFWSLQHKSDVMQWALGAWRLLTSSSKIRLWCKKTSKCVRCQINSLLKDAHTETHKQTRALKAKEIHPYFENMIHPVCFFYHRVACCLLKNELNWQVYSARQCVPCAHTQKILSMKWHR